MKILSLANEVLALSEKATEGPLHVGHVADDAAFPYVEIDNPEGFTVLRVYRREDEAFYCSSRTAAPLLARALIRAVEALDGIDHELGRPEGLGLPAPVENASFLARDALADIEALVKEEGE